MDEEEIYDIFKQDDDNNHYPIDGISSPVRQEILTPASSFRAYNPLDSIKNLPIQKQEHYSHLFLNHKTFPGVSQIFNIGDQEDSEFIEEIQQSVFESNWFENALGIKDLFDPSNSPGQADEYTSHIHSLKERVDKIHNNTFNVAGVNKTVSQSFYDHMENFLYLNAELSFLKDFEQDWGNFINQIKKIKGPGPQLITAIYDFWMKNFKAFLQEIWKYSEKFTLSFVKKNKDYERESRSSGMNSNASERMMESEKRRPWKNSELQLLHKIIQTNGAYTQVTLNKIANQLNRTPTSISSKIQKIIKNTKRSVNPDYLQADNMTLTDRIVEVLKNYSEGQSRQTIIQRINEHYEMGYDQGWTKSVAQILSSRPQFVKIKGVYGLIGTHQFDMNKKTFKDKVVNCLLKCQNQKADLKKLVEVYVGLYEKAEGILILSEQRIKAIEASISKSLCRYDIFDKSHSKTVYKLRQFCSGKEMQMDIQVFLV